MTSIANLKSQWEQQARDDERKAIVDYLARLSLEANKSACRSDTELENEFYVGARTQIILAAMNIERGKHRKANNDA